MTTNPAPASEMADKIETLLESIRKMEKDAEQRLTTIAQLRAQVLALATFVDNYRNPDQRFNNDKHSWCTRRR